MLPARASERMRVEKRSTALERARTSPVLVVDMRANTASGRHHGKPKFSPFAVCRSFVCAEQDSGRRDTEWRPPPLILVLARWMSGGQASKCDMQRACCANPPAFESHDDVSSLQLLSSEGTNSASKCGSTFTNPLEHRIPCALRLRALTAGLESLVCYSSGSFVSSRVEPHRWVGSVDPITMVPSAERRECTVQEHHFRYNPTAVTSHRSTKRELGNECMHRHARTRRRGPRVAVVQDACVFAARCRLTLPSPSPAYRVLH